MVEPKGMYRQGDVLFIKTEIDEISKCYFNYPREDNIVLLGEANGHAHRLVNGTIYGDRWAGIAEVQKNGKIIHEEHGTIPLPEGYYNTSIS